MTYTGGKFVDRRGSTRRDIRVPILITPPDGPSVIQNISLGGMKVNTEINPKRFQINDEISFLVNREYLKLRGQGKILWTSGMEATIGIEFTELDNKSRESLKEFLSLFCDTPIRDT